MEKMNNMVDNKHKDAHKSGWFDAYNGYESLYPEPKNSYQQEYKRGYDCANYMYNNKREG